MMATVTSANLLSPNYTTNHENEQQKLHRTAGMANTDMVENDSDFEGNVTIPKFTHYTNFESSQQDSTDSEQEINTEPSTPAEISGDLPKRNKRKNFKPRCSNVSAYNSEDESTNFGEDNAANSNEDSNDSDSNICPRTDSPNLNLEELHLANKHYNSLGHSNNNNLKAVRRRKTISIRHVLNPPSPKSEPNRTFPIDLSNNQKSESEGDGENSSEADESNKRNIQNVVSRNIFSIDHLSKSAQSEPNSTTIRYAGTSTAMDMREYAVNTMRELLGIYGLTSEVAESISKQLPVGAFNSGKILDNLTALTPQHFPHPRLSCNINNRHRTSPPSQPPTPPHTPHTPPSNVSEQPKIPQNLPPSLQIHPLNLNSSTPNSVSERLSSVTTSASDFQKSFENSPFVRQNPQHVPQNLSLNNQQKNALNLNINNNASIKQKKSTGIYSNVNGQSTRDGAGHLDQMPLSPRSAYGSYDVDQMRQKDFSKLAGASNPRGIFPSSLMMKCESLSPPPNGQDKHPMNALIAHTSSSRDSNLGSSPQNSSSSSKSGGGSGGGSSTPLDYSRYVKRFSSSLECGNLHCKDMNYREHFHCLDCVDTDISNNGPMARVFAKKEEMIRHWKWHKKRDESLQHGFMRYSPLDDCSARYNACQHNRRQTHYHCIHDNCDKVYISTSDVQMHANYHRKDSAIIQEGFQRFRATEDCSATYCAFFGQRTTHFHCRRQGCKYTFKNKADMEKHKSYHIKDEQLSRDGFKKFMKHEQCPYDNCRFSKVCNHIHCIRPQCNYVLHSSGQLFSHKRKHERKDSELAYRKFKLAQSMMKSFQDGVTPIPLNMSQETYQHLQSSLSQEQMQQLGLSPEQLAQLSHEQMVRLGLTPDQIAQLSQHEQIMRLGLTADQIAALPPEQIARLGLTPEQFAQLTADQMARLGLTPEQVTQLTAEQMTRLGLTPEQIGQMTIEQMARLGLTPDQISPEQLARLGLTQEQLSQMTPDQLAQLNVKSEPIDQLQRMSLTPDQTGAMNLSSLHAAALNLNRDFMEQYEMLQQSSASQMSNSGDNSDMSEGRNSPISYAGSESNLAIDLSAGDQQSSDIPQNDEQQAVNCVDWNNEQFWKKYCQFFSAEEKCIAKDSRICELQFQEHYHCLVDNCCMIFNCKDGVREHARNHEQQEQVTEAFYVTILPKQQCIEENCVYQDKEKHYHCTWDNCREVVLMSDKPFRRLDHYKMHEYSRKLSLTKDPLTMTHLATSIDGMFRRKRGRPPKNRVIEVWNDYSPIGGSSLMDSPQAIFTSFKLPKASTSTQQLNSKEQEVLDSHDEFENSSPMITDYNLQGFDVYSENDKCPDSLCPYLGIVHYHCNQVRCLYCTDKDDILIMHSKDFHDNVDILEGFEFYDRNVDCRLPECHSNKVNRHFHCTRDNCNYSFVRYSTMAIHNQKHLTDDNNCSVITSAASQNLKFEEQIPAVTVKKESAGEEVAPFESQPERVSVVKASGTFFPLSGLPSAPDTSKQITPEPALPDHPTQNSPNNSGHTLYGPELSCSRPFCKLKRKHHYHCNACNQAFSEVDRLVTHISKHSTGALNSQLGNPEDNNNQQPIESHHITPERHVKSPVVTPKPSHQKINVTPLQNLQNPPPQPIPEIDPTINPAASPLGIPLYPGSPVSTTAAPALSAYGDYFGNFSSANLASQFAMISQQTGIPPQFIPQTLYQNQSLLYQMQQHGLLLSQQAASHSILMPQSPGASSSSDPMSPLAMMAANLNKRALSPTMNSNEMSPEQKKARIQNSMRILKDEPVPEGYVRFRFNEDCQYTHCGYREHQTHFHCQRPDCGYSFCDKTRFVQHTARHERLDTLMGGDFQQYRANVQCGRQDCAYTTTLGSTQNKASHFHCLKCDFVCTDTNKVVAHRRQHQKLDSIQAAGFEKFTPSQQCRSGNTCQHSGKQTHYHCLSCQYAVLGLAQMSAHKYRHLES